MKIFENWGLKIVAVIFSISIWFYVQGKGVIETALRYNILFTNLPEGLYIEEVNTPEIMVWVKGPKHLLNNILKNHNKFEISLKMQKPGRITYEISQTMFNLPSSFQILKIQPEKITIRLSPIVEKKVRVVPRYSGNRKIKVMPEYVVIKGPKHIIENIYNVETEEITSIEKNVKLDIKLSPPSEKVILKPETVNVIFMN